ncbi:MAG: DMT family transporter [Pseudomonadota bacterium]
MSRHIPFAKQLYDFVFADLLLGRASGPRHLAGAMWVFIAMFMLAGLIALGRHFSKLGFDPLQILFFRNLFCVLWMLPLLVWRGRSLFVTDQFGLYGLRVGLSFTAMLGMFHAVALLPIGEVTAIGFLSPLFATVFAVLLIGETVGPRRWAALIVGFGGAIVMLLPTLWLSPDGDTGGDFFGGFGAGQAFALMSALALGLIGPLVKTLTKKDDPDRVVFLTNVLLTPLSLVPAVFVWRWPELSHLPLLLLMGFCAVVGHMALVRGYAATDASLVQAYKFVRLPFAVGIGYLAFGETIGMYAWIGGGIVFAASVYIARREANARSQGRVVGADRGAHAP